jgi:predicted XRE-type DNA-binding protein
MKNNYRTPIKVWSDPIGEVATRLEIEKSRIALQKCLEIWCELNLGVCKDITALVLNPEKAYSEAISENVKVPVQPGAKFQIAKDVYIRSLSIPIPDKLYRICRDCRKFQFSIMPELWIIEGNKVIMNQDKGFEIIDSQSIYISDPEKIQLISDLQTWVTLTNNLNQKLIGELMRTNPATNEFCRGKFKITDKYVGNNYQYEIAIDPEFLRQLL